ncbi:MAG: tetratricopeptide repeat protein [Myxococcales bacterium]|nr:tetratricopeptide repeat protein [Myxococcales bacterium]
MASRSKYASDGGRLMQTGFVDRAIKTFEQGVAANPKDVDCWLGLGRCHLSAGRAEQAMTAFQRLLAAAPEHLEAQSAVAMIRLEQGDASALEGLQALSSQKGAGLFVHLNLANALQARGDKAGAEAAFERALESSPNNPFVLVELGELALGRGDPAKAAARFKPAAEAMPMEVVPQQLYARALARSGQPGQALAVLTGAVQRIVDAPTLHDELFQLAMLAGAFPTAVASARALQRLRPGTPNPLYLEGLAHLTSGNVEQARSLFEQTARLAPSAWPAKHAWAKCLMLEKKLAEAQKLLEEAVGAAGNDPGPANDLATVYLARKDGARAQAVLAPVAAAHPDDDATQLNLALAYVQQGKPRLALPHVKSALASRDRDIAEQAGRLKKQVGA